MKKATPEQNPVYVDDERLRGHAVEVGDLAERADVAAEAADYVSDLDGGYGIFCRGFAETLLDGPNESGKRAVTDAAKALHGIRRKLEANADSFSGTDENNKQDLEREGEGIAPPGPFGPNGNRERSNPTLDV